MRCFLLPAWRTQFYDGHHRGRHAVLNALGVTGQADSGALAHLKRAANSMKVTFQYCRSEEEVERRKWQLSSRASVLNETQVLRGWKRVLGIVQVAKQLSADVPR